MRKIYLSLLIVLTACVFNANAQTFPCGSQDLNDCECLGTGVLIADSEPCSFGSAENQVFLLVDVNDATVSGDADDDSIVGWGTDGIFTGVGTGDYTIYSLVYSLDDAAVVEDAAATGNSIADLQGMGDEGPAGTWTSDDPNFELIASDLATVNGSECDCPNYNFAGTITGVNGEPIAFISVTITLPDGSAVTVETNEFGAYAIADAGEGEYFVDIDLPEGYSVADGSNFDADGNGGPFVVDANGDLVDDTSVTLEFDNNACADFVAISGVICNGTNYFVVVTLDFGNQDGAGYNVASSHDGGLNGTVGGSFVDGPFEVGTGYSYTVTSLDVPSCTGVVDANFIDCTVTAIELVRFDGIANESGNELFWTTASENESDYFTLEYSTNGVDFKPLTQVQSSGNSSVTKNYAYLHEGVSIGKNYYRLSETDLNGVTVYVGDIVELTRSSSELSIVSVYPVPANEFINVNFSSSNTAQAQIEIYSLNGKLVKTLSIDANIGLNTQSVNVNDLSSGSYLLNITVGTETVTSKIIKN